MATNVVDAINDDETANAVVNVATAAAAATATATVTAMGPALATATATDATATTKAPAKGDDIIIIENEDDRQDDGPVDALVKVTSVHIFTFF